MGLLIVIVLIVGVFCGIYIDNSVISNITILTDPLLKLILFFAGLSIGSGGDIREHVQNNGIDLIMVPLLCIIGTLVGAVIAGLITGYRPFESMAVGSGLGWYSLAYVIAEKYDAALAALSFLTSIFREILAIVTIPYVAKHIGYLEAIVPGGATTMDTTLPPISQNTDAATTITAFFSAAMLTFAVPVLIEFFMSLQYKGAL